MWTPHDQGTLPIRVVYVHVDLHTPSPPEIKHTQAQLHAPIVNILSSRSADELDQEWDIQQARVDVMDRSVQMLKGCEFKYQHSKGSQTSLFIVILSVNLDKCLMLCIILQSYSSSKILGWFKSMYGLDMEKEISLIHSGKKHLERQHAHIHLHTFELPVFFSALCPAPGTDCSRQDNAKEMLPGPFFGLLFKPKQVLFA